MIPGKPRNDRRVQKTQNLLRRALASLIREKNYSAIVVKEILARANVGRSAFYSHFRDKDDLLNSSICEMLRSTQTSTQAYSLTAEERMVWFSLPIFEYHYQHRESMAVHGRRRHKDIAEVHEQLGKVLQGLIGKNVSDAYRKKPSLSDIMPAGILIEHMVSTFILVLNWWVKNQMMLSPMEVDRMYRKLILPCVSGVLEQ